MSQEQIPDHRTPDTSIRLLKLHVRRSAVLLPKSGIVHGKTIPQEVMRELRNNLAAELRELRQYPDNVTLAEARELSMKHKAYKKTSTEIRRQGNQNA